MADDNIDFRFLGRQVQNLQGDVRDLRAGHLRLEGDVAGLRADISRLDAQNNARFDSVDARFDSVDARFNLVDARFDRLEGRVDRLETEMRAGFRAVDARFDQAHQTMATNFQILLAAIQGRNGSES